MAATAENTVGQPSQKEPRIDSLKIDPFRFLQTKEKARADFLEALSFRLQFLKSPKQIEEYADEFDNSIDSELIVSIIEGDKPKLRHSQRSDFIERLGIIPESFLKFNRPPSEIESRNVRTEMKKFGAGNGYGTGKPEKREGERDVLPKLSVEGYILLRALDEL